MGDADVIPGVKLGFCWRTGEGKEEGDGADRRARTVSEGGGRKFCGSEASGRRQAAVWAVRSWAARMAAGPAQGKGELGRAGERVNSGRAGREGCWARGVGCWAGLLAVGPGRGFGFSFSISIFSLFSISNPIKV